MKLLNSKQGNMAAMAIGIAIVLIVGIIAAVVFFNVSSEVPGAEGYSEEFTVDDPTTDEAETLQHLAKTVTSVTVYNGSAASPEWRTLSGSDYSINDLGDTVTIDKSALQTNDTKLNVSYDTEATSTVSSFTGYAKLAFGFIGLGAFVAAAFMIIGIMRGGRGGGGYI